MTASASNPDWRVLRALCLYRLTVAPLLAAAFFSGLAPDFLGLRHPGLFQAMAYAWFAAGSLLMISYFAQRPAMAMQPFLHMGADIVFVCGLLVASSGIDSGLAGLLLVPVLGIGMIAPPRTAALAAAAATIALFGVEIGLQFPDGWNAAPLTRTGMLGALLFIVAAAANTLSMRVRRSEAIAARAGSALDSLSRLNDTIVESMRSGVLVVDETLRIRTLNHAARALLHHRGAVLGHALTEVAPELALAVRDWRAGRPVPSAPIRLGRREVLVRYNPLAERDDAPLLLLLEDARRARDEAQRLKLVALGRLSASIAHEIRNPLSAIRQAADLLEPTGGGNGDEQAPLRDIIRRHAERIEGIVRDVLDISRGRAPETAQQPAADLLHLAHQRFREAGEPCAAKIRLQLPETDASTEVLFDAEHFCRVMHNLWRNSCEHGAELITVSLQREGSHLSLLISDDGNGLDPAMGEQIFEPFFTTRARGTGLGLYLARTLCEANHAVLHAVERGKGAHFMLHLPAVDNGRR